MVGAGAIAADAKGANNAGCVIQSQATTKHIYAANPLACHWVFGRPEIFVCLSRIGSLRIDRVTELKAEQGDVPGSVEKLK